MQETKNSLQNSHAKINNNIIQKTSISSLNNTTNKPNNLNTQNSSSCSLNNYQTNNNNQNNTNQHNLSSMYNSSIFSNKQCTEQLEDAIIDLYLSVKIRKQEEIESYNEDIRSKEISLLKRNNPITIIDYIKTSIEILINLRVQEKLNESISHSGSNNNKLLTNINESPTSIKMNHTINSSSYVQYEEMLRELESELRKKATREIQLKYRIENQDTRVKELENKIKSLEEEKEKLNHIIEELNVRIEQHSLIKTPSNENNQLLMSFAFKNNNLNNNNNQSNQHLENYLVNNNNNNDPEKNSVLNNINNINEEAQSNEINYSTPQTNCNYQLSQADILPEIEKKILKQQQDFESKINKLEENYRDKIMLLTEKLESNEKLLKSGVQLQQQSIENPINQQQNHDSNNHMSNNYGTINNTTTQRPLCNKPNFIINKALNNSIKENNNPQNYKIDNSQKNSQLIPPTGKYITNNNAILQNLSNNNSATRNIKNNNFTTQNSNTITQSNIISNTDSNNQKQKILNKYEINEKDILNTMGSSTSKGKKQKNILDTPKLNDKQKETVSMITNMYQTYNNSLDGEFLIKKPKCTSNSKHNYSNSKITLENSNIIKSTTNLNSIPNNCQNKCLENNQKTFKKDNSMLIKNPYATINIKGRSVTPNLEHAKYFFYINIYIYLFFF